jgi:hypothetical protein
MSDEYGNVDLKEYAEALSEVINKAMEGVKQPKFSELNDDRELMVYTGGECAYTLGCTPEVMDKDDLLAAIQNGEIDRHGIVVYLAEKNVAHFREDDIRDMVESMMESAEQYEDWDEDMMADIRDSAETKAFLQYLNGRAEAHAAYDAGLRVEMDWEDKDRE